MVSLWVLLKPLHYFLGQTYGYFCNQHVGNNCTLQAEKVNCSDQAELGQKRIAFLNSQRDKHLSSPGIGLVTKTLEAVGKTPVVSNFTKILWDDLRKNHEHKQQL